MSAEREPPDPSRNAHPLYSDPSQSSRAKHMTIGACVPVVRDRARAGVQATEAMDAQRASGTQPLETQIVSQRPQQDSPGGPARAALVAIAARKPIAAKAVPAATAPSRGRWGLVAGLALVGALGVGAFKMCG